jgi:hypothetical protein
MEEAMEVVWLMEDAIDAFCGQPDRVYIIQDTSTRRD